MREIDIEKIMEEIRAGIKEEYKEEIISFQQAKENIENNSLFDVAVFRDELYHANMNFEKKFYFDVGTGIKGFFKKFIRKLVTFLGVPLVEHQNDYNAKVVRMFNQLNNYIDEQEEKMKELERVIEGLEEKIARLNEQ